MSFGEPLFLLALLLVPLAFVAYVRHERTRRAAAAAFVMPAAAGVGRAAHAGLAAPRAARSPTRSR